MRITVPILCCLLWVCSAQGAEPLKSIEFDPLRQIYALVRPGATHADVDRLLRRHSFGRHQWSIHERDIRERADIWNISLDFYAENIFAEGEKQEFVGTELHIYFVGSRVGCLYYRYWAEKHREELERGDMCRRFTGK